MSMCSRNHPIIALLTGCLVSFSAACEEDPEDMNPGAEAGDDGGATTGVGQGEDGTGGTGGDGDGDGEGDGDGDGDAGTDGADTTGEGEVSYADDIQPIWDANCVDDCHNASGEWSPMLLEAGSSHSSLTEGPSVYGGGPPVVTAGSLEDSFLWRKLTADDLELATEGLRMPKKEPGVDESGPMLPQAELDLIEAWILAGAPE